MRKRLPSDLRRAAWLFAAGYLLITVLGILLTIVFAITFQRPSAQALGLPASQDPSYLMTLPYHPLLNVAWLPFAWLYLRTLKPVDRASEALKLGIFWTAVCILLDVVGWVLIPHPWAMTWREFYIDYQPWITLIYVIIFLAPIAVSRSLDPYAASE